MLKTALAIFLIAHGLTHVGLATAPNPADPNGKPGAFFTAVERSWLLPQLGLSGTAVHWVGILLVTLSTLGFVLVGLSIFGVVGLSAIWRIVAIISAIYAFVTVGLTNPKAVGVVEIVGVALYLFGSYINTQVEYARHIWKLNPHNKGKPYTAGLFQYAMHINYFGDLVLFVGLALLSHINLLIIPFLMFVNFAFNIIPSLDRYLEKKYSDQFVTYAKETKKLIAWVY